MKYFAYVRVSTTKQKSGVSLEEQRRAIVQFAQARGCTIAQWFEETETAAYGGRRVFTQMLARIDKGEASGLILHKIDRGARNLKDWALIGDLLDRGVDIRFAHENLDMESRGGRLAADIQAVIAADYIRNLREEVKKGLEGRLRQGLYPFKAPLGYRDHGAGRAKTLDPQLAPLVAEAFARYAARTCTLRMLATEMCELGLVNQRGGRVSVNTLSNMLNNPFYTGVIRIKRTGAVYSGVHRPLISAALFDQVQTVLRGKTGDRLGLKHRFLYRRLIVCACGHRLVGERHKGFVYYRCHSHGCRVSLREERIEAAFVHHLWTELSTELAEFFISESDLVRDTIIRTCASSGSYREGSLSFVRPSEEIISTLMAALIPKRKGPQNWQKHLLNQQRAVN